MKKLALTLLIMLCAVTSASAYQYVFDWAAMQSTAYTNEVTPPTKNSPADGVDLYVRTDGDKKPTVYAWEDNGTQLLGSWPGTQLTELKSVASINNEDAKRGYYKIHINSTNFRIQVSFNGDSDKSAAAIINGAGDYFLYYNGNYADALAFDNDYYSGGSTTSGSTIYARVIGDDFAPTIYAWFQYWNTGWPGQGMSETQLNGEKWYKWTTGETVFQGIIFSKNGDENTKTHDITNVPGGESYYYYYPWGDFAKYEVYATMNGRQNNFKEWDYTPFMEINGKDVTFTTKDKYGHTATLTVICNNAADVAKVKVVNNELQFPRYTHLSFTVNDGYHINRIWLGKPTQGNATYQFFDNGARYPQPAEGHQYVTDMLGLWNHSYDDHLYNISNNSSTVTTGEVIDWNETYFLSSKVYVMSEGITLEDLVDATWGVKQLNFAFDHDLVAVEARDNGNREVLICRSVDYVANHNPIKEGQKSIIDPETGEPYEWSDPNTKQYAWIALELPEGTDLKQYEGKQLRGIHGGYCTHHDDQGWHISWYNPTMVVDEIRPDQIVAENVPTHLNNYTVANLTDQSYQHVYDNSDVWPNPANRPNENGEVSFDVTGKYYLIKPRLWELCNLHHVMRTDDEVIYIPDSRAVMPTVTSIVNGEEVEVIQNNVFEQNDVEGYANIQRPYETGLKSIWRYSDSIMNCIGQEWRMRYKIYYIPDALVFASDFHPNDYPLGVPDRNHDEELSANGNIGMHIIGIPVLCKYEKDILISASDYWSRYKYSVDKNVYRNDLHIAPNTLKETFGNTGNLLVYREEYRGNAFVREVPIARIIQKTASGLRAGGTNRVEYQLQYLNLDADNEARRDDLLKPNDNNSDGTIFKPIPVTIAAADTAYSEANPGLINRTFVIGEGAPDRYVSIYDMFYSNTMLDIATNETLATDYYYRVKPEEEQPNLEEVSGYAPIYKTDVNIVNHATYTQEDVDNDLTNSLQENNTVTINFTPNQSIPVTEYRVYSGSWTESDTKINKDANTLVIAPDNKFLAEPISVETSVLPGRVHVPEAYTDYNNNTYGCYKQKVGDAIISTEVVPHNGSQLISESQENIYWDYKIDENGDKVLDYDIVTKMYHVDLRNVTALLMEQLMSEDLPIHEESRYMLRMWRQVEGDDEAVLLNTEDDLTSIPVNEDGDPLFFFVDAEGNQHTGELLTNYGVLNELYGDSNDSGEQDVSHVSDTFFHHELPDGAEITYYATLYVYDEDADKYYVKKVSVTINAENMGVITNVDEALAGAKTVASVEYYNALGMKSKEPFSGVNVMVTRYTDGSMSAKKIMKSN